MIAHLKKIRACCLALFLVASLGACNTVEGVGEDVESAGEGLSEASRDVRDEVDDDG